jgi:uncharacterized protein YeaC (DUF1315 family)
MSVEALVQSMSEDVYNKLREAVETGKWFDGTLLSDEQREHSMQAVMMYQAKMLDMDEHMTVSSEGEIIHKSRQQLKNELQQYTIVRFKQNDF